jgi:heat shock protein HslJ
MKLLPIHRLFTVLLAVGLIALAACAPIEPPAPGAPAATPDGPTHLAGTEWNLVGYGRPEALTHPLTETLATLDIEAERMSGSTGCNHYAYNYTAEGQALTFASPGPVMTLMACPEPLMQQEADFVKVLSAVAHYTVEGDRLTLTGAEGVLVFEVATPLPFAGTTWHLSSLAQNDAVVSTAVDEQITLTLKESHANGFAGCNDYFGAYELNGNGLKFGALGSTRKACEGDPGRRETEFLTAIHLELLDLNAADGSPLAMDSVELMR